MNIASTPAVQAATAGASQPASDAVQLRVLKKALDAQESMAAALIASLPPPAPVPQGPLGTRLDVYA